MMILQLFMESSATNAAQKLQSAFGKPNKMIF